EAHRIQRALRRSGVPGADAAPDVGLGAGARCRTRRRAQELRPALVRRDRPHRRHGNERISGQFRQGFAHRGIAGGGESRGRGNLPRRHPSGGRTHPGERWTRAQRVRARPDREGRAGARLCGGRPHPLARGGLPPRHRLARGRAGTDVAMSCDASVTLRDARREEVPLIIAMLADDALGGTRDRVSDQLPAAYFAAFDAIVASRDSRLLVAELAGEVVGTMQITFIPGLSNLGATKMLIEAVRVTGARRGSGLGRQMVAAALWLARARGCKSVELLSHRTRTDAQRFYAGLGFVASHVGMKLALD